VATVSLATVNENVELPPPTPSGWLTSHETTHSPLGNGFGTDTVRETVSTPTCGVPTAKGEPLQTTSTVLVAPNGLANVSSNEGGEASTVLLAAGVDETSELSAAWAWGRANAPTPAMATNTVRARRKARMGGEVLFMLVAQR
jgi:hypothetical protein